MTCKPSARMHVVHVILIGCQAELCDVLCVEAGGLMFYGVNLPDYFRRAGEYIDTILHGSKTLRYPSRAAHQVRSRDQYGRRQRPLGLELSTDARADEVLD
jgi:hypothetical protein